MKSSTVPLALEHRARLQSVVDTHGEAGAIRVLGIPHNTLVRAISALPLRRGTVLMIIEALSVEAASRPANANKSAAA